MIQVDGRRIGELTRYLSKSEDVDLWLKVIMNPHMLPDGQTVGKAVLTKFLVQLSDFDRLEVFIKNDCALWFRLFSVLRTVYPVFVITFIRKLLTLEHQYENKEAVVR